MSALAITKALGGRWYGTYGMVCCPAHDDRAPSCKVMDDPGRSDGIDVHCFAGCDWRDIKAKLRRQDLLAEFAPKDWMSKFRHSSKLKFRLWSSPEPEPNPEA